MKRKRESNANGRECASLFEMEGRGCSVARGKYVRPSAKIDKEAIVRAARMSDPDFFRSLRGDDRKVAILTLERGLVPMLRNCHFATDAICEMCREKKGERYSPIVCIRKCPMFKAVETMEKLVPLLEESLAKFHHGRGNGGGDGVPKGGPKKTGPGGGGDGKEDKGCLVPA